MESIERGMQGLTLIRSTWLGMEERSNSQSDHSFRIENQVSSLATILLKDRRPIEISPVLITASCGVRPSDSTFLNILKPFKPQTAILSTVLDDNANRPATEYPKTRRPRQPRIARTYAHKARRNPGNTAVWAEPCCGCEGTLLKTPAEKYRDPLKSEAF
jgi:hypothetical protein